MTLSANISANLPADIARVAAQARAYKRGDITAAEFKKTHAAMGIYEQRTDGSYMVRIRATGGVMTPQQLLDVISLARDYGAQHLHVTTRQELQIHSVSLDSLAPLLTDLMTAGLSTQGGGGDTVRNMLVDELAGIDAREAFDTTPYARALTRQLLLEPDSYGMPRKYKIAFASSEEAIGSAGINDLGLVARVIGGRRGFRVYVGGGAGGKATVGWLLYDFLPSAQLYAMAEALKRLFNEYGNRENRAQARIRHIFYRLGVDETLALLRDLVLEERAKGRKLSVRAPYNERPSYKQTPREEPSELPADLERYELWQKRYVVRQMHPGYVSVLLPIPLGDVALDDASIAPLIRIAEFAQRFGPHTLRFTISQNIRLRNIPESELPELYRLVDVLHEASRVAPVANNIVSCTGASTCRLGICLSKHLATAIRRELTAGGLDLDALGGAAIHVSGCPNSCGMQAWADLGFAGRMVRQGERLYPAYQIFLGANRIDAPRLGEAVGVLSAHRIPAFVSRLLGSWQAEPRLESISAYLRSDEAQAEARRIVDELKEIPSYDSDPSYYTDL